MKRIIHLIILINITFIYSQSPWQKTNTKNYSSKSILSTYTKNKELNLYTLNTKKLKGEINILSGSNKAFSLPTIKGDFSNYYVTESYNFTRELSVEYSAIKSYNLKGIDDKTASGKISIGSDGIHITIFSGKNKTLYITPYSKDSATYIIRNKETLDKDTIPFNCSLENNDVQISKKTNYKNKIANDGNLRIFRLALACTGEYAQFHINNQNISDNADDITKKEAVLSAMNTTISRVNAIFERDLSVRLNIVINNEGENELIFLDSETDSFNNNNSALLINQSQTICDAVIGTGNYDIGHTFTTDNGGLASLGVICLDNRKAKGVTGSATPIGDIFDIDIVAHEIGHQFGAPHTFNGSGGSCDDANRNNETAVEPGSGSTIMAYAGICSPQNIQNNSDDYFHAVSITAMLEYIKDTSCATEIDTNNNNPIINMVTNYSVPLSTPIVLKAIATDEDNDNLTYCWEQIDNEIAIMPPLETNIAGPSFRSLPPTDSPNRYLPTLSTIIGGNTSNEWEVLPKVSRDLNFSLTVRDNNINGSATARENITISIIDTDPFSINTPENLSANANQTITWNVGETNKTPINCSLVNIKLSLDGGLTFPITLIENTTNDGTETLVIPEISKTEEAIILIEASDNFFYNISDTFEIINSNEITFSNITGHIDICNQDEVTYELSYVPGSNINETTNFSITGFPEETGVSITPKSLNKAGIIYVTVANLAELSNDEYIFTITANSSEITEDLELTLQKRSQHCNSFGYSSDQTSITAANFASISNISTKNTTGYSDFKDTSAIVNLNESYNLSVNINTDGLFSTTTKAWIDWNQNCVFDTNEEYLLGDNFNDTDGVSSNSPLIINVPENAVIGSTVMRITTMSPTITSVVEYPSPCEADFFGEVEDYTIMVNDNTASNKDIAFNDFILHPNPSEGILNVSFETSTENINNIDIKLIDVTGRIIIKKQYNNTLSVFTEEFDFSNLNKGIYLLYVSNGNKQTTKKIILK